MNKATRSFDEIVTTCGKKLIVGTKKTKLVKRIFLDLDDVLNKFTMPALYHVGCPVDSDSFVDYPVECGYDIVGAANIFSKKIDRFFDRDEFWSLFGESFWENLPLSDEAVNFVHLAMDAVGYNNVYVLTAATGTAGCLEGKRKWVMKYLGSSWLRKLITCTDKFVCAHDSLLIDDSQDNVCAFTKAGGLAITVPRPWNPLWGYDALLHVKRSLKRIL